MNLFTLPSSISYSRHPLPAVPNDDTRSDNTKTFSTRLLLGSTRMTMTPIRTSSSTSARMTKQRCPIVRLTRRRPPPRKGCCGQIFRRFGLSNSGGGGAIFDSIECVGEICSQDIFFLFLIFVGVVCLDRGIVMFFCGAIGVECFCWCEVGYGYLRD